PCPSSFSQATPTFRPLCGSSKRVEDFLTKPVSSDQFLRAVERAIAHHEVLRDRKAKLKERKPDNLYCQREGVVEQPHQDQKNETQYLVYGERDKNKRNDDRIVKRTAEA